MTLQERIENDLREALKKQDIATRDLLRVLMVEITKKNKIASDEETIRCIKKQIESAKLCHTEEEIPLLEVYLPAEISDLDMKFAILSVIEHNQLTKNDMGKLMPLIKEKLGADFDGKRVSAVLKTL